MLIELQFSDSFKYLVSLNIVTDNRNHFGIILAIYTTSNKNMSDHLDHSLEWFKGNISDEKVKKLHTKDMQFLYYLFYQEIKSS